MSDRLPGYNLSPTEAKRAIRSAVVGFLVFFFVVVPVLVFVALSATTLGGSA